MAIYMNFNFVKKAENQIVGHLPSLKTYEAKGELVQTNLYNDATDGVSFYGGGYIFTELGDSQVGYDVYVYNTHCFFIRLVNQLSNVELESSTYHPVFLFEPSLVRVAFENILEHAREREFSNKELYTGDMKLLETFLQNLVKNENLDLLISCTLG